MSPAHVQLADDEDVVLNPHDSNVNLLRPQLHPLRDAADGRDSDEWKGAVEDGGSQPQEESHVVVPASAKEEAKALIEIASPMMFAFVMNMAVPLTTFICIGQLNHPEYLAAAGLAQMTVNITGWAIVIGLLSAQETLSAQAFGAANNRRIGYLWLRAQAVSIISLVPMGVVWWNISFVLSTLGQDKDVATLAADYSRPMITAIPAYVILESTRRFLQAQQITRPIAITSLICGVVHIILCPTMTFFFGWGMLGAVCSLVFAIWFLTVMLLISARTSKAYTNGTWPVRADFHLAFKGWIEFYKLGLPGVGMIAGEWIGYEVAAFFAGLLGTVQIAAHNIIAQLVPVVMMISLGMGTGAAMRIGSFLGAGRPDGAKRCARIALLIVMSVVGVVSLCTMLGRRSLARIFTSNEEVLDKVEPVFFVGALYMLADNFQGTMSGVIRGAGLQAWATPVSLLGCYGVAIPLGILFAFKLQWDLVGIWLGMLAGWTASGLVLAVIVFRINWTTLSEKARERALRDQKGEPDSPKEEPQELEEVSSV